MSVTGTYKVINNEVVKVSEAIPKIGAATSDLCSFAKPYWETNLESDPIYIKSRKHKAEELRKRGLIEKSKAHGGIN